LVPVRVTVPPEFIVSVTLTEPVPPDVALALRVEAEVNMLPLAPPPMPPDPAVKFRVLVVMPVAREEPATPFKILPVPEVLSVVVAPDALIGELSVIVSLLGTVT
jgi:hypothetical protein